MLKEVQVYCMHLRKLFHIKFNISERETKEKKREMYHKTLTFKHYSRYYISLPQTVFTWFTQFFSVLNFTDKKNKKKRSRFGISHS